MATAWTALWAVLDIADIASRPKWYAYAAIIAVLSSVGLAGHAEREVRRIKKQLEILDAEPPASKADFVRSRLHQLSNEFSAQSRSKTLSQERADALVDDAVQLVRASLGDAPADRIAGLRRQGDTAQIGLKRCQDAVTSLANKATADRILPSFSVAEWRSNQESL